MKTLSRVYIVEHDSVTRAIHLVKATSQAQAVRRVARDLMTCRPAHSLEVVEHMTAGVTVLDATSEGQEDTA